MEPPFPNCPACGLRFGGTGVWRPRVHSPAVVVLFHSHEGPCDKIFGVDSEAGDALVELGSIADYRGDMTAIINASELRFDLTV
jgi:hypothetical protein